MTCLFWPDWLIAKIHNNKIIIEDSGVVPFDKAVVSYTQNRTTNLVAKYLTIFFFTIDNS